MVALLRKTGPEKRLKVRIERASWNKGLEPKIHSYFSSHKPAFAWLKLLNPL